MSEMSEEQKQIGNIQDEYIYTYTHIYIYIHIYILNSNIHTYPQIKPNVPTEMERVLRQRELEKSDALRRRQFQVCLSFDCIFIGMCSIIQLHSYLRGFKSNVTITIIDLSIIIFLFCMTKR